jgi:hypothetical protein
VLLYVLATYDFRYSMTILASVCQVRMKIDIHIPHIGAPNMQDFHFGPGVYPVSYPLGAGIHSLVVKRPSMKLATHLHLVQR